jgi:tetratricopeptide (TPR) repeat protein/O-antigen ligase
MTRRVALAVLGLVQVVCPLLFFTNLTRNPYYTQIVLLNLGILLVGILWLVEALRQRAWRFPLVAFQWPLVFFLGWALLASIVAWVTHPLLRPGILFETTRVWTFTLVNSVMAIFLPILYTEPVGESPALPSIWVDVILALLWSACWWQFHMYKDTDPTQLIWDTYGFILWLGALVYAVVRARPGRAQNFFHIIFAVSLVAGIYGIFQYGGKDMVWGSPIQPYGGRPVSTFGNPNFLSSYLLLVCPVAVAFALNARKSERFGYALVAFVAMISVLCTLTRSSYVGLAAVFATMFLLLGGRARRHALYAGGALILLVLLVLVFPHTPVSAVQSPLQRFVEIFQAAEAGHTYAPWHQRLLIWSSAWDMFHRHVLLGIGWGCFELFYPFFQGKYMFVPILAGFRTHANNAHNVLMELWSQVGMVGAGFMVWMVVTVIAAGWITVRRRAQGLGRDVAAALLAGFVGMIVDNFFGNVSIFFAMPAFLFWWNVGALTVENRGVNIVKRPFHGAASWALWSCLLVFFLAVGAYYICRWEQELYYFEGFKEAKIGTVDKSYKSLEKAYAWFPGEVNSNYELGNSYARYGKLLAEKGLSDEARKYQQKAVWAYSAALKANPGYDEIYFNLGVTQSQMGDLEQAARNLETSVFINPLLRDAYAALGSVYIQQHQLEKAAHAFTMAVAAFPRDKDLWNNLGYTYSQLKQHDKSFDAYKQAVMIDPGFNQAWQNLATAATDSGRRNDPILLVPSWIRAMEQGLANKNYPSALDYAQRIEKILPDSADAHLSLGNILFYVGRPAESEQEFRKALELHPGFEIAQLNLGRLYQSQGKNDLARAAFKQILAVDAANKDAQAALASLPPK